MKMIDTKPNAESLFTGFGTRMFGFGLDLLFVTILAIFVVENFLVAIDPRVAGHTYLLIAMFLYFAASWASPMRATPVQFAFGMRVVDKAGDRLSLSRAALRSIALVGLFSTFWLVGLSSIPYLGDLRVVAIVSYALVFLAAVTPNRQAAHDLLARSIVVNRVVLGSSDQRDRLREHVADNRKRRRPSLNKMVVDAFLIGVWVFVFSLFIVGKHDRNLRSRIDYAVCEASALKVGVEGYYDEYQKWPAKDAAIGVSTKGEYPDGGYYELEEDGVIRIRFEVRPELKNGSIVFSPEIQDGNVTWACRAEGQIAQKYLPANCRD
jgi:uncharacterized RDD family membrane protein YckC